MKPFETQIDLRTGAMSPYERRVARHASDMAGYFHVDLEDEGDDPLIYECFGREIPPEAGHIGQNITIIHPGTIDGEYYMTKGHYHANPQCAEVYLCLSGQGYLLMQTSDGEADVKEYRRDTTIYIPPGWAHRSVNTGAEPLVFLALYPADSGHDYGSIAEEGFWARVLQDEHGEPTIVPCQDRG